mmetsp:Transcript_5140/g.14396  ORF Transcript_5140/g.14396 Transcript_5140/m.14396 type:complete len:157 (-) Transcript_5140:159-629(-)
MGSSNTVAACHMSCCMDEENEHEVAGLTEVDEAQLREREQVLVEKRRAIVDDESEDFSTLDGSAVSLFEASVTIGFETPEGVMRPLAFTRRPLGLKYTKTFPITVTDVQPQSHAEDLGVLSGWKLREIGGEAVRCLHGDVHETLCKKTSILPFSCN